MTPLIVSKAPKQNELHNAHPLNRPRILIADDERSISDSLALILSRAGYEVRVTYNGSEAVRSLPRFLPDLLLTDVSIPGMSGVEIAMAARQALPRCHIVFLTAHICEFLENAPWLTRGFHVLAKPLHPLNLLDELAAILPPSTAPS